MLFKEQEKNYFNTEKFLRSNEKYFVLDGNCDLIIAILNLIPFCNSSRELINLISFSNNAVLFEKKEFSDFLIQLKECEFDTLIVSIVFSFLKLNYTQKKGILTYDDWEKLIPIILKPEISDYVLDLLIELNIFGLLIETKSLSEFITGIRLHFYSMTVPDDYSWDLKGFKNLLQFLKVEKNIKDSLLKKTSNQKNFQEIKNFFSSFDKNLNK